MERNEVIVYSSADGGAWKLKIAHVGAGLRELPDVYPTKDEAVKAAYALIEARPYDRQNWFCRVIE